jgi:hypothetical protein
VLRMKTTIYVLPADAVTRCCCNKSPLKERFTIAVFYSD